MASDFLPGEQTDHTQSLTVRIARHESIGGFTFPSRRGQTLEAENIFQK
jgi:hypothetical protein